VEEAMRLMRSCERERDEGETGGREEWPEEEYRSRRVHSKAVRSGRASEWKVEGNKPELAHRR
jgi:hypothetical protein